MSSYILAVGPGPGLAGGDCAVGCATPGTGPITTTTKAKLQSRDFTVLLLSQWVRNGRTGRRPGARSYSSAAGPGSAALRLGCTRAPAPVAGAGRASRCRPRCPG